MKNFNQTQQILKNVLEIRRLMDSFLCFYSFSLFLFLSQAREGQRESMQNEIVVGVARALAGPPSFCTFPAPLRFSGARSSEERGEEGTLFGSIVLDRQSRSRARYVTSRRPAVRRRPASRRLHLFYWNVCSISLLLTSNFYRTRARDIESVITKRKQDSPCFKIFLVQNPAQVIVCSFLFVRLFLYLHCLLGGWMMYLIDKREKKRLLFVRS